MIDLNSPIVGNGGPLIVEYDISNARRIAEIDAYVAELHRLCTLVGFDWRILFAQAWHETAGFTSQWWTERLNPAGIGVTGDPTQNDASHTWTSGQDAARAHVAHLCAYVFGGVPQMSIPEAIRLINADPRYKAVFDAGYDGTVEVLGDLGNGKWATDPQYAEKIAAKANAIFQEDPMADPVIYDLATDYARFGLTKAEAQTIISKRFTSRVDGAVRGRPTHIMFHIQAGNTRGSLKYWVGVSASSTVMIQRDGSILRVIPEEHGPWTNGDDYAPTPAGQPLVNQPGNSNIWTLSMEVEGGSGAEVLNYPEQMAAIEWQARDWMTRYPDTAQPGHQLRHADVQQIQRPNCPGAYYPVIMERLALPPTPPVAIPTISWTPGETGIGDMHGTKVLRFAIEVTAKRKTVPHVGANAKTKQYGDSIKPGEKRIAYGSLDSGWLFIQDDQNQDAFPRVARSAFYPLAPRPRDAA